ncbi:CPBP family intramembrane glutamic endopeptidase [Prochlorococcus sp. MIT 1307]|uniref:CPBP family intramembrane glutamic endopeptidase n=1 Tax=Prochlorococcus sp. MIT 1307 TaxID=3096219 RepID=UPI002A757CDB|nr:CPBP family intramembrane glutamic endopeptidase [Prochlorococcus sp. MIT 1307]
MPLVYICGWLSVKPLALLWPDLQKQDISLLGTIVSFVLFVSLLSSWSKIRWGNDDCFIPLGLVGLGRKVSVKLFLRGLFKSFGLLAFVLTPLLFSPYGKWLGYSNGDILVNALFLGLVVGFAEEIIFRGWLFLEMNQLVGTRWGVIIQAVVFSLVHTRFSLAFWELLGLLLGLFLLGLLLAFMRMIDHGSLWGCMGLHGGLVGGWFLVSAGLVEFSPETPGWLFGPGGAAINPLGGLIAIFALIMILFRQRTALAIAGRPLRGARKASSNGDSP